MARMVIGPRVNVIQIVEAGQKPFAVELAEMAYIKLKNVKNNIFLNVYRISLETKKNLA